MAASPSWIMHPGAYIKEEMEERGWSQRDLAFILGCSEQAINPILNGKRGISPEMAKALGEAFDVPAEFFANLQQAYDLQMTFPISSMLRKRAATRNGTSLLSSWLGCFVSGKSLSLSAFLSILRKRSDKRCKAICLP